MSTIPLFIRKDVAALPVDIEPNTVYFVRTGTGFDIYVSDSTGVIAHKANGTDPVMIEWVSETDPTVTDFPSYDVFLYRKSDGSLWKKISDTILGDLVAVYLNKWQTDYYYQLKSEKDQPTGYVGLDANNRSGWNQSNPLAYIHVGPRNVNYSIDSKIIIAELVDDNKTGNSHAFSDSSDINRAGTIGYNSFDSRITVSGTYNYDHITGFQSRVVYNSTGTITEYAGYESVPVVLNGTVVGNYGFMAFEYQGTGGVVQNSYGLWVQELIKATNNWGVYTEGSTPSHFGGYVNTNTDYRVDGVKVVSNRQAAIPDATQTISENTIDGIWTAKEGAVLEDCRLSANELHTKVNAILAALRSHGLIET